MTEKAAVLAYNKLFRGLEALGETAISRTIIAQIKHQEPGHFAFYRITDDLPGYARTIGIVEYELLWARDQGMKVPRHVLAALRTALAEHLSRQRLEQLA